MEILKQAQYHPYPVEEQVVSFFGVTNGYLDSISVEKVKVFEEELLGKLRASSNILEKIREEKALSKDLEAELRAFIESFKKTFEA